MDLQLETKRLILRTPRKEDFKDLQEGLDNINIAKNITKMPNPYTLEMVEKYFSKKINDWNKEIIDDYLFVIELKSEKKIIGAIGLHDVNFKEGTSETGSWINENYWKKGYITEAKVAANDFAFKILKLKKLISPVFASNVASNATQKKMGYEFKEFKEKADSCIATGEVHDENVYELTREKWFEVRETFK